MEQAGFKKILSAIQNHNAGSWAVADAIVEGIGKIPKVDEFNRLRDKLARSGFDFEVASLKAYHQTAMTFPPEERRDATFSAHETARSNPKALDAAIEVYGKFPTVKQVRSVKANLKAGLPADFVLPDLEDLERQKADAWQAYDEAVASGADDATRDALRAEATQADALLAEAQTTLALEAEKEEKRNLKKVRESYWIARALARRLKPEERARLGRLFRELAELYGSDSGSESREAAA